MGYYTKHNLEIYPDSIEVTGPKITIKVSISEDIGTCIENGTIQLPSHLTVSDWKFVASGEASKWYEHEKDMRVISKHYPSILFTLHGRGEEQGDVWVEYHQNGKMQRWDMPKMSPNPFDPKQLK